MKYLEVNKKYARKYKGIILPEKKRQDLYFRKEGIRTVLLSGCEVSLEKASVLRAEYPGASVILGGLET